MCVGLGGHRFVTGTDGLSVEVEGGDLQFGELKPRYSRKSLRCHRCIHSAELGTGNVAKSSMAFCTQGLSVLPLPGGSRVCWTALCGTDLKSPLTKSNPSFT